MNGRGDVWHSDEDGTLRSEAHGFKIAVFPATGSDRVVRFGVMRNGGDRQFLIGSGQADDERTAMKAALRMAQRLAAGRVRTPEPQT